MYINYYYYSPVLFFFLIAPPCLRLMTDTLMNGMIMMKLALTVITPGKARVVESRWVDID